MNDEEKRLCLTSRKQFGLASAHMLVTLPTREGLLESDKNGTYAFMGSLDLEVICGEPTTGF